MNNNILFVDDEPNILTSYNRMLKKLSSIETALGGEEFLLVLPETGTLVG